MKLKDLIKFKLPDSPGVYFFLKGKEILYIGKATSLKDRVRSYFSKDIIDTRGPVILDMVFKSDGLKWEETQSVLEALILEAELIKKYQPKYNTKEKSDKSFNYVVITDEELPKIKLVRGKDLKPGFTHFGPYPSGGQLKEALRIVRKIFPFIDDSSNKKNNQEFYKQIHLTPENKEEYKRNIRNLKLFFKGKKKEILRNLKKDMFALAKAKLFEKAGEVKRQIFALEHINDVSLLKLEPKDVTTGFRIEAYDIAHMSGKNMVGVMSVIENGMPVKSEYRKFKIKTQTGANDTGALVEVLDRRIGHSEWRMPNLIVVDGSKAQINFAKGVLGRYGIDIPIVAVTKNERHQPESLKGDSRYTVRYEREILLANSEAHRFGIAYHKDLRSKSFLKK